MSDTGLVEVKIRHALSVDPRHLTVWPVDRLEELLPLIGKWCLRLTDDDDNTTYSTDHLSGEFVYDRVGVYFEILIDD